MRHLILIFKFQDGARIRDSLVGQEPTGFFRLENRSKTEKYLRTTDGATSFQLIGTGDSTTEWKLKEAETGIYLIQNSAYPELNLKQGAGGLYQ
jgi:hypothetical protein